MGTVSLGYSITNVEGSVPEFNILQPQGASQYKYHQSVASLSVDSGHTLAWNTAGSVTSATRFVCGARGAMLFSRELADRVVALRRLMSFSWSEPANRAAERPRVQESCRDP